MLKIHIFRDPNNWRTALADFERHDYVHTYDFHAISEEMNEGAPVLFVGKDDRGRTVICWPALLREIPGTELFDLTSVYGYGGPLINRPLWKTEYIESLFTTMSDLKIIAVFSRMHPLFKDEIDLLEPFLEKVSDVPVIDTAIQNKSIDSYRKDHKRGIKKLTSLGFESVIDEKCGDLDEFIKIYHQSMRDLHAREYFYFNRRFFEALVSATDFRTVLSFVKLDGVNVCATLNIITGRMMHAHLSGDLRQYRKLAPCKLDYAATHDWALKSGLDQVLLGPGRSEPNDTLLDFKQGFAKTTLPLYVFKHVLDRGAYIDLSLRQGIDPTSSRYFPAYRDQQITAGSR